MTITFVDTSVLVELLQVPNMCERHAEVRAEFARRATAGEQFVMPITAVIETGNHVANSGDRRAAQALVGFIEGAIAGTGPFLVHEQRWDDDFLTELCRGSETGQLFVDHTTTRQLGAGDLAILIERERYIAGSHYGHDDVQVWTFDDRLRAYAS